MPRREPNELELVPYSPGEVPRGRALVLAPHPDDEVLGCAGAILRHRALGDDVRVVVATDGGAGGEPRDQYVRARAEESAAAAGVLGCEPPCFWGLEDRSLRFAEPLVARVAEELDRFGADVLYFPSLFEVHPDHRALSFAALEAVRRRPRLTRAVWYEVGAALRPNLLLDITRDEATKLRAIACFRSQLARQRYDEQISALNRFRTYTLPSHVKAAEAYRVLSVEEVQRRAPAGQEPLVRLDGLHAPAPSDLPLISVVVRTAGRDTLAEALASVGAQTYPRIEVVLVDATGGALRGLPERCGDFPVRTVRTGERLARAAAANAGLAAARGQYACFLDDDDWLYPGHLERLRSQLVVSRFARAAYAGVECVEVGPDGRRTVTGTYNEPFDRVRLSVGNYIPIHSALFERSLVSDDGCRFDEALDHCEDWDFWLQVASKTQLVHVPEVSAAYRMPGGSALSDGGPAAHESWIAVLSKWAARWAPGDRVQIWTRACEWSDLRRRLTAMQQRLEAAQSAERAAQETARAVERTAQEAAAAVRRELEVTQAESERYRRAWERSEQERRRLEALRAEQVGSALFRGNQLFLEASPRLHRALASAGRALLRLNRNGERR